MFRRAFIAALLAATPSLAQPVAAPDCTVDGRLADSDGLKLDITYRCRATQPLSFRVGRGPRLVLRPGSQGRAARRRRRGALPLRSLGLCPRRQFDVARRAARQRRARHPGKLAARAAGLRSRADHRHPHDDGPGPGVRGRPAQGRRCLAAQRRAGASPRATRRWDDWPIASSPFPRPDRCGRPANPGPTPCCAWPSSTASARARAPTCSTGSSAPPQAQSNYWQGFTARQALLGLVPVTHRRGVGYGRSVPGGGVTVMVEVGTDVDRRRLFDDWVLTHELIHTGMPFIRRGGTWFMEGAATYVEPIIRARAGWKTEEEVWREWVDNMPQGRAGLLEQHGQCPGPGELLGRRHLHAAGRRRPAARHQRRQGAGGLPGRRAVERPRRCAARHHRGVCRRLRPRHRHHRHERPGRAAFQQAPNPSTSPRCGRISAFHWSPAASRSTTARRRRDGAS